MVGLLRARFSKIMQTINDHRMEYIRRNEQPPEEWGVLMAETQRQFSELLKASDILVTSWNNIRESTPREEAFRVCIEDWALGQTAERLKEVKHFFEGLSDFSAGGISFEPRVYEQGLMLVQQVLDKKEL